MFCCWHCVVSIVIFTHTDTLWTHVVTSDHTQILVVFTLCYVIDHSHPTPDIVAMLDDWWASAHVAGPPVIQHWTANQSRQLAPGPWLFRSRLSSSSLFFFFFFHVISTSCFSWQATLRTASLEHHVENESGWIQFNRLHICSAGILLVLVDTYYDFQSN